MPDQSCCRHDDLLNQMLCEIKSMELPTPATHQSAETLAHVDLEADCSP